MKTYTISEFMSRDKKEDEILRKLKAHFERHHIAYKVAGTFIIVTIAGGIDFASTAEAASDLDRHVKPLYQKLVNIGKWFIIFKGGTATIKSVGSGDMDAAKRNVLQYVMIYLVLLGLPWIFDQADTVFREMEGAM
jgi:hypothetical protein